MSCRIYRPVFLAAASIALGVPAVHAIPAIGVQVQNNCYVCHARPIAEQPTDVSLGGEKDGRLVIGKMSIPATGVVLDLGTQLDGQELGELTVFKGAPGDSIQLLIDVLDGEAAHAVQLKQLEKGGQKVSLDNMLVWTETIEPSTPWEKYTLDGSPPYFALGVLGGEPPSQYAFTLNIDAATPPDVYNLVFAFCGQDETGLFYQEENFYLEVAADDGGSGPSNELVNISTRGLVGQGDEVMVGGFVVTGEATGGTVLVRGIGPTLGGFGVANTVEDPVIKVFDSVGNEIAMNDDWGDDPDIAAASEAVGAFALDAGSKDAALLLSNLPAGSYTVQLSGKATTSQNGLLEVYRVQ